MPSNADDFLAFFAPQTQFWETDRGNGLHNQHYTWPEPPARVAARLQELQQLSQQLDERLPAAPDFADNLAIDYARELNPRQQAAVAQTQGPLLVIAGAGSGKTRTLVYRLNYLLEQKVPAGRILLLTFTRRAAREMLERAQQIAPKGGAHQVMGGTFHSFCAWLLRRLAPLAQLHPGFSIIDTTDSADILDLICNELKLRGKDRAFPRKARLQELISRQRNLQIDWLTLLETWHPDLLDYREALETLASTYGRYKLGNQLMDYDDLLIQTLELLQHNPAFARKARSFFDYIMVDEYQDTNGIQKALADALAAEHRNLMVVGDDAQSIYGFRGANYENILRFPQTWPDCRIVRLEQNYRSTKAILDLGNAILKQQQLGFPKHLQADRPGSDDLPEIRQYLSPEAEAEGIAEAILNLHHDQQWGFEDMAVLYRAGFHSNYLQAELLKRRIPFVVYGGIRFVERRHIKDMLAHARLLLNPLDAIAWHRVLQLLPGVGKVGARQIIEHVRAHQGQLQAEAFGKKKFGAALQALQQALNQAAAQSLPAAQLEILKAHYLPLLRSVESDYLQRLPDLAVLLDLAGKYDALENFLTDFTLEPPSQQFMRQDSPALELPEKPLVLSTVHSAKGLEWRGVFVMHLLDGLLPGKRSLEDFEDLEEERRLFYVACSRAKDRLWLSLPGHYHSYNESFFQPSRFVSELPPECYQLCSPDETG
ncbi:MAG: ATP-dependent helicase [Candidatus Sericytochromatia bacterium]|nr:ATP-dependent helicase [Candidatus Sericytochromatia bacterium]